MTSSDTPENGKKPDDKADGTPEQVDAEIVDNDAASAKDDRTPLESETVSAGTSEDKADGKGLGLMTPGMILLGLLAIVLVFVMLSQDNNAPREAAEPAVAAVEESQEAGGDLLAEAGDDLIATTEQTAPPPQTQAAEAPAETALAAANEAVEEPVSASQMQSAAGDPAAGTSPALSEDDRRQAEAVEEDLEAHMAALQPVEEETEGAEAATDTGTQSETEIPVEESAPVETPVTAAPGTEALEEEVPELDAQEADETAPVAQTEPATAAQDSTLADETPETPALIIAAEDVVTDEKLANQLADIKKTVKEDVLAETQAALAAEQERARRQEEELNALRQDFDSALAQQEERSEEKIAELEERMDKLQNRDVAAATKQAAISIALSNLQRQMFTGAPFAEQLQILEGLVSPSPAIAELQPFAEEGLPTMLTLQTFFSKLAVSALAEARRAEADGWLGQIGANLSGLFSVRKIDKIEGDTPSAMISRAEAYLEEGNLREALREIGELEGAPAEAMAPWMTKARSRIAADDLLSEVSTRVLIRLN